MTQSASCRTAYARSYLFVPGDRPERFQKAFDACADAVILDLEDAVSLDNKSAARDAIANFLTPSHQAIVRINAVDTEWLVEDVELCQHPGIAGVMLPKTQYVSDVRAVAARVGRDIAILALIETAQGMANVQTLSQATALRRLVFGSIDFQLDMGIDGDDIELLPFRSMLVLASRCAGLPPPCDGITTALNDSEMLTHDALRARRLGFGAKLCVHPRQVQLVNETFSPDVDALAWAKRVLQAAANARGAAVALDGKMIDRPVVIRAQRIIEASREIASAVEPLNGAN